MSDVAKQERAEAMLVQTAMIDGMVDMANQRPELMPQFRQAIQQGARALGLSLDALRLMPNGFVGH